MAVIGNRYRKKVDWFAVKGYGVDIREICETLGIYLEYIPNLTYPYIKLNEDFRFIIRTPTLNKYVIAKIIGIIAYNSPKSFRDVELHLSECSAKPKRSILINEDHHYETELIYDFITNLFVDDELFKNILNETKILGEIAEKFKVTSLMIKRKAEILGFHTTKTDK